MRRWLPLVLAASLVAGLQAARSGRVEVLGGCLESGLASWGEEIALDDGRRLPRSDFLRWEAADEVPPLPGELWVERADGVAFRALALSWLSEVVSLDSLRLGKVTLPYDRISRIVFLDRVPSAAMLSRLLTRMDAAGTPEGDLLWLERDQIAGVFDSITGDTLRFEARGVMMEVPLVTVLALGFPSPRANPPLVLSTRDGFRIPVTNLSRPEGGAWRATTPEGDFSLAHDEIAWLEAHPPHQSFLGDLKTVEAEEALPGSTKFPGAYRWPHRVNAAVHSGRPLRVRGREWARGLGVHSDSRLVFTLPKGSLELCGAAALDDEAQGLGSVHFFIRGDGKVLFESGLLTGSDAPRHFRLDVAGVSRLELEVVTDPGQKDKNYTLDRAAWLGLILVGS